MAVTAPPSGRPGDRPPVVHTMIDGIVVHGTLAVAVGVLHAELTRPVDAPAGGRDPMSGLVAAPAAGTVFHPLRLWLRWAANRLPRVERDPYRVADRLSRALQEAAGPAEGLATAVVLVRRALRADGAAVEVDGVSVRDGVLGERPVETPLIWHGEPVGRLLRSGPGSSPVSSVLLNALARHLAELAHAVRLAADLRRSRERVRSARDEERHRLGRELHDGLGPALTNVAFALDEARRRLGTDPGGVEELLVGIRREMSATIASARELVYGLRPPALDDLGLEAALRAFAGEAAVTADGSTDGLPAAVEVAAYRIAQEAFTNARRHARATSVIIRLRRLPSELCLEVVDDGIGLPDDPVAGVGLTSMRERAAEVGGSCVIGRGPGGGTEVIARLPAKETPRSPS